MLTSHIYFVLTNPSSNQFLTDCARLSEYKAVVQIHGLMDPPIKRQFCRACFLPAVALMQGDFEGKLIDRNFATEIQEHGEIYMLPRQGTP